MRRNIPLNLPNPITAELFPTEYSFPLSFWVIWRGFFWEMLGAFVGDGEGFMGVAFALSYQMRHLKQQNKFLKRQNLLLKRQFDVWIIKYFLIL